MKKYSLLMLTLAATTAHAYEGSISSIDSLGSFEYSESSVDTGKAQHPPSGAQKQLDLLKAMQRRTVRQKERSESMQVQRPKVVVDPLRKSMRPTFELNNLSGSDIKFAVTGHLPHNYNDAVRVLQRRRELNSGEKSGLNFKPGRNYYVFVYSDKDQNFPDQLWRIRAGKTTYVNYTRKGHFEPQGDTTGNVRQGDIVFLADVINQFRLDAHRASGYNYPEYEGTESVDQPMPRVPAVQPLPVDPTQYKSGKRQFRIEYGEAEPQASLKEPARLEDPLTGEDPVQKTLGRRYRKPGRPEKYPREEFKPVTGEDPGYEPLGKRYTDPPRPQ